MSSDSKQEDSADIEFQGTKPSALTGFLNIVKDFRYLLSCIVAFGAAPFLLEWLIAIGPPWPHTTAIAACTSVVTWLVLFCSYTRWQRLRDRHPHRIVVRFAFASLFTLMAYLALYAYLVKPAPDFSNRVAGGFLVKPSVELAMKEHPDLNVLDILKAAEYEPTRVWIEWTVFSSRFLLLVSWMLFFGIFSFVISVFVLNKYEQSHTVATTKETET